MEYDKNGKPLSITWEECENQLRSEDPEFWRKVDYLTNQMCKYDGLKHYLDNVEEIDFFEDLSWWTKKRIDIQCWLFIKWDHFKNWIWRIFHGRRAE